MTTTVLPAYDWSDFRRVLVVVAHPDDAEYGLSCAVSMWTGIRHLDPDEVAPLRAEEQRAACATVGVTDLTLLEHPDGQLMDSMELRRDIAKHIREFQPDTVITANFELEAYGSYNQADHRVAGLMTVDAVRDADNPWVHRDLELPAHKVERLLVVNPGDPTHRVIVDEKAEQRGIESLACHKVSSRPSRPPEAQDAP